MSEHDRCLDFPPESAWADIIARYDQPVPRYTSYPAVPSWHNDPAAAAGRIRADAARAAGDSGIALYVHVPFCPSLCWYCACNRFITKDESIVERYLDAVEAELQLVSSITAGVPVRWLHWGGGTPNSLTNIQTKRLFRAVARRFSFSADAEISIEMDPRLAARDQFEMLAALGFNRVSFGVQDVQEATQRAINRLQSFEQTAAAVGWARECGINGVNVDLIYGLPLQSRDSFARTVAQVLGLKPSRVAAYAYAHVPWVNRAQRAYESDLPERSEKFGMAVDTIRAFTGAGYRHIGIDHFAAPGDELADAEGFDEVRRTFMGYSPRRTAALVGIGASAISACPDAFAQNQHDVLRYIDAVNSGGAATRGCILTAEDGARQAIIESIMARGRALLAQADRLSKNPGELVCLERDGIVECAGGEIVLTPIGRLFARNVAACFDAYFTPSDSRHAAAV